MAAPTHYAGKLLVASPKLLDPNFQQSVVLMLGGDDDGAIGLVLNRWSDKRISELWQAIFHRPAKTSQVLHLGGPVFGPLMILHTQPEYSDLEVIPGLHYSTRKDAIEEIVENDLRPYKLFVGNAGWGETQLAREIDETAWYLLPATLEDVFSDDTELWKKALAQAGSVVLGNVLNIKDFPNDSMVN